MRARVLRIVFVAAAFGGGAIILHATAADAQPIVPQPPMRVDTSTPRTISPGPSPVAPTTVTGVSPASQPGEPAHAPGGGQVYPITPPTQPHGETFSEPQPDITPRETPRSSVNAQPTSPPAAPTTRPAGTGCCGACAVDPASSDGWATVAIAVVVIAALLRRHLRAQHAESRSPFG